MKLVTHVFGYWKNGMDYHEVIPEQKRVIPFVVRLSEENWIPINVIVFAESEAEAIKRVVTAIKIAAENEYLEREEKAVLFTAKDFKRKLDTGIFSIKVEKYDTKIIASVPWACNDTIF